MGQQSCAFWEEQNRSPKIWVYLMRSCRIMLRCYAEVGESECTNCNANWNYKLLIKKIIIIWNKRYR